MDLMAYKREVDQVDELVRLQSERNRAVEVLRRLVLIGECVSPMSIEHCSEQRQRLLAEVKNAKSVLDELEGG